jgi:hypothetical protein
VSDLEEKKINQTYSQLKTNWMDGS